MDLMEVILNVQKKSGKNVLPQKKDLNVSDVWHMWDVLVSKYDAIENINILLSFAKDRDLKLVLKSVLEHFEKGAAQLEQMMLENEVALPQRPPQSAANTVNLEVFTDRYIFMQAFGMLKGFMPILARAFNYSGNPALNKFYKNHIITHMEIIDNVSLFAEAKGYPFPLPNYRP